MNDSHLNQMRGNLDNLWLLTLPQVAKRLQVSLSDVRRKVRRGVIPIVRLGPRQVRVLASDLQAYVESRRRPLHRDREASQ
jgi:excisionase family DNA binding protein